MPLELLRALSKLEMPTTVTSEDDIDKVRALRAARYVVVMMSDASDPPSLARVLLITDKGWMALNGERPRDYG